MLKLWIFTLLRLVSAGKPTILNKIVTFKMVKNYF